MFLNITITLAVLYHVLATVGTMAGVLLMLRAALGIERHGPFPRQMFRWGELHLWVSGALVIALGLAQHGLAYLDNPKLWTKVVVISMWGLNSWLIKRRVPRSTPYERGLLFGVSCGALIYGTLLGVAKPLAGGVMPFGAFLAGYCLVTALCVLVLVRRFEWVKPVAAMGVAPDRPLAEIVHASNASP